MREYVRWHLQVSRITFHASRFTYHVSLSHVKSSPSARSEGVAFRAELDCAGRGAFEDIRHHAHAPRKFDRDLRDMFLQRRDLAEDRHGSARAAAGNFRAV